MFYTVSSFTRNSVQYDQIERLCAVLTECNVSYKSPSCFQFPTPNTQPRGRFERRTRAASFRPNAHGPSGGSTPQTLIFRFARVEIFGFDPFFMGPRSVRPNPASSTTHRHTHTHTHTDTQARTRFVQYDETQWGVGSDNARFGDAARDLPGVHVTS